MKGVLLSVLQNPVLFTNAVIKLEVIIYRVFVLVYLNAIKDKQVKPIETINLVVVFWVFFFLEASI